jgi:alpha-glucosidase
MKGLTTLMAAACVLAAAPPAAAATWTVSAPGRAAYATVRTETRDVVVTARLGTGTRVITARVRVGRPGRVTSRRRAVDTRFTTPAGKRRVHELHARVLTLAMSGGRRVEVLAAPDGVAIRQRHARAPVYDLPAGADALLQRYSGNYERPYSHLPAAQARGRYGYPALINDGATSILLSEAGLRPGQGAAHLTARRRHLRVQRADRTPDRGMSPWRFAVFGLLGSVVGSSLPLSLGRPSQIEDTGWIRPGRVAWSWWSDGESPRSLARQQQFADGAAARGWEYVLVDEGWDGDWVPELVRYAADRGVRVLLWTHWRDLRDPADRARLLRRWAGWGVAGIKVDFLGSDRRRRIAVYDAIARAAARRRLLVDFHGCTLPRGIQRTWPNVMTLEAVRGAEYARNGVVPAAHDVNLVFTRNVVGSMDYTPVTFSAAGRTTSAGHQLALAVAYESGLQHLADTPESYAARPAADAVLRDLPVAWNDTRLLDWALDERATIARRHGDEWWVAGLRAGPSQPANAVDLSFLEPGRGYRATITTDDGADGLTVSERTVTSADSLTVPTAADGGFIVRLRP